MAEEQHEALYTTAEVRRLDAAAIESGIESFELMTRAGSAAFSLLRERWPACERLMVLCGSGKNGGDGFVLASLAKRAGFEVTLCCMKSPYELGGEVLMAAQLAQKAGLDIALFTDIERAPRGRFSSRSCVFIDALLGTGFQSPLREDYAGAISWLNQYGRENILSLDMPSGVNADTGVMASCAVMAALTISFIGRKRGLYTCEAKAHCGDVFFSDLDVPRAIYASVPKPCFLLSFSDAELGGMLVRGENTHKGLHGHLGVLGGDKGLAGAALLAAEAGLRTGAGMVSLFTREEHVVAALARRPELMVTGLEGDSGLGAKLAACSSLVLGPGMGRSDWSLCITRDALDVTVPTVIDADALNLIADGRIDLPSNGTFIMTPHPGEAARMLGLSVRDIQQDRFSAASSLQRRYGGVVVLKGAGTLIADDSSMWVCHAGNPGMAVAGMGDVLAGIIGALLAQGLKPLHAARVGVWVHSRAADIIADRRGIIGLCASDLYPVVAQLLSGKHVS